ncbi:hypothetical protein FRC06_003691, partial [Ceratobasidium sp. 370]
KGNLESLSRSVGVAVEPKTQQHTTEHIKQHKASAVTRGNASQPDPLPSTKRHKGNDQAKGIHDYRFEDLTHEADRMEWLYLAIEQFGDRTDYHGDPEFQDEDALWEVWEDLRNGGLANVNPTAPPPPVNNVQIRSGMTKALEPSRSGRPSAPKLVPADQPTIGLAGTPIHADNHHKLGYPPAAKPANADHTSVHLDGTPPSPPRTNVSHRPTAPNHPSLSHQPPHQPPSAPGASRRAPLPVPTPPPEVFRRHAQVHAPRQEVKAKARDASGTVKGVQGSSGATASHAPQPGPPAKAWVDASPTDDEEAQSPPANEPHPPGTPTDEEGDDPITNPARPMRRPNKRQSMQIQAFTPAASELAGAVMDRIRIEMAVTCPFPELTRSTNDPSCMVFDDWVVDFWAEANEKLRANRERIPIEGCHTGYACMGLVTAHFELRRIDPGHKAKATNLLTHKKWLSPWLADDELRFQHDILRDAVRESFFHGHESLGAKYHD